MRLEKDPEVSNLYWSPRFRKYYFRKYITAVGREVCRSLKTSSRHKAIQNLNKLLLHLESEVERITRLSGEVTFDDVLSELLETYQVKAEATFASFETVTRRHLLPYLTGMPISEVARGWEPLKASIKANAPGMSLGHVRRYLTRILNYSVEREYIDGFKKLRLDPGEKISVTPRAFEPKEVSALFNAPSDKFKAHTLKKLRLMMRLTLECGLRPPQEIRLLRKDYIDFEEGYIHLPAEVVKTRTGRIVPVSFDLLFALKEWCDHYAQSPWVFPKRGNPNEPATRTDKTWQRLKKELGIKGKFYWFRHSHATAAIEGGLDAVLVANDMGTSPEMLKKIYVKPSRSIVNRRVDLVRKKYQESLGEVGE